MPRWILQSCSTIVLGLAMTLLAHAQGGLLFREDFNTLDRWEPLYFDGIERHSLYEIRSGRDGRVLAAVSKNSASALVHRRTFDVREFPILKWRWKVNRVHAAGDYRRKAGDDYPLRLYVMFAYDPSEASLATRLQYGLAKAVYGRYPPHSSLNYIWANRDAATEWLPSPYTDRAILIPVEQGARKVGQWVEETVNMLEDYRKAFGGEPPAGAALAVMSDADNTDEGATGLIDFIEVRRE